MEPGYEDREDSDRLHDLEVDENASMEPGHEDREDPWVGTLFDATVGVDISEKCLKKYIDLTKEEGSRAVACISNGLEKVKPFEADTLTVCGMGGNLICEILSNHLDKAKSFNQIILQANNGIYELRKFLFENGFYIENEIDLFEKDIYYQILDVREGPASFFFLYSFISSSSAGESAAFPE